MASSCSSCDRIHSAKTCRNSVKESLDKECEIQLTLGGSRSCSQCALVHRTRTAISLIRAKRPGKAREQRAEKENRTPRGSRGSVNFSKMDDNCPNGLAFMISSVQSRLACEKNVPSSTNTDSTTKRIKKKTLQASWEFHLGCRWKKFIRRYSVFFRLRFEF